MSETSTLTFQWTPTMAAFAIFAVAAAIWVSLKACRRTRWRPATVALEALRLLIVFVGALLLGAPEWVEPFRPDEKPVIAVLWDDSTSMQTRDVAGSGSPRPGRASGGESTSPAGGNSEDGRPASGSASERPEKQTISRADAIEQLTRSEAWESLRQRADVVIQPIGRAESAGDAATVKRISATGEDVTVTGGGRLEVGTDLSKPLIDVAESNRQLLGVVLASDGDWNQGLPPVAAAGRLRSIGVPVFTVPVGSPVKLPDLELISFDVPTFAVAGKPVRIPFSIDSSLPRDAQLTVTMTTSDDEEITKQVRVAAMSRTSDALDWTPTRRGELTLEMDVPTQTAETREDNNSKSAPISIREEKLKVLVIESVPRWEYRYLRNALSRDPGVEVSCLLFHPGLDKRGGGNSDYIEEFPPTKELLASYDVVFLGDVGLNDDQLTPLQCQWLRGLVQQQASGLVFLPGWQGRQFELLDTELGELMPVVLDDSQPGGWGSRTPQHFDLTQLGRRSLLTKLADTAEENWTVWANLPGFQWYAPVVVAKPGTETLCVHQEVSNQYGRLPLLVTRTFGAGKVLFMGTDGAWRWRKGVEDLYHYRFWGQVVRWMAYRRNMSQGETMRLFYTPEQPEVRQSLSVSANVMELSGEPLSNGNVTLRVEAPSGQTQTVRLKSTGEEWGAFAGEVVPVEPGEHQLTLFCAETGQKLETKLFVQGQPLEQVGNPARPEVLEEIARVTRGQVMAMDQIDEMTAWLSSLPDPPVSIRRVALWSHPLLAGGLILCLALFWVGRKIVGLV